MFSHYIAKFLGNWSKESNYIMFRLDESPTINQNIFGASQNDGLLIECTYIAQSESTEFSIEQISEEPGISMHSVIMKPCLQPGRKWRTSRGQSF